MQKSISAFTRDRQLLYGRHGFARSDGMFDRCTRGIGILLTHLRRCDPVVVIIGIGCEHDEWLRVLAKALCQPVAFAIGKRLGMCRAELSAISRDYLELVTGVQGVSVTTRDANCAVFSVTLAGKKAIQQALANNGLSGFTPSTFGSGVLSVWEDGGLPIAAAVQRVIDHYKALALIMAGSSDGKARANALGVSDSEMLHHLEADVTTLRLAELQIDPVGARRTDCA